MAVFQHALWGYELTYPDGWAHQTQGEIETFAVTPQALDPDYSGENSGQIMVRAGWNCPRRPIEPVWNEHIGKLASWLGAKKVGSAPWRMSGAAGMEAEVVLAKKDPRRLWSGILEQDFLVLHFLALHLKEERAVFEPPATRVISSLRFLKAVDGVSAAAEGWPLPPGYEPIPPQEVLTDISDFSVWRAYSGRSNIQALQAFYWRETANFGWRVDEYAPFPAPGDPGFARLRMERAGRRVTLAILPFAGETEDEIFGRLVFKLEP
jgi:hypothetical protein